LSDEARKASPKLVKSMNRMLIVNELKKHPRLSRADLAKKTKLSRPCVSELVKEMIEEGLILEVGVGASNGGKRPILLEYNVKSNFVIGVLITNRSMSVILADMQGDWIGREDRQFSIPAAASDIIGLLEECAHTLLRHHHISAQDVLGMAIGIPGIASETDRHIGFSPGLDLQSVNLPEEIEDRLGIPAVVANDVYVMTMGEFHRGSGRGVGDLLYFFIGNGIAAGIVIDGKFHRGAHLAAGEAGYMIIGDQTKRNRNMGVFESNYGLLGIEERMKRLRIPVRPGLSVIESLRMASEENGDARVLLEEVLNQWAAGIVNAASILDPQLIILAGEIRLLDAKALQTIVGIVRDVLPKPPDIRVTSLGFEGGLHGAVHLALQSFTQTAFQNNH